VFIEPKYFGQDQNDDHPPHNVMKAEKLIADVYNAVRSSPLWNNTVLVVYFDEHGGFYDHVVPGPAVPPDDHHEEYDFKRYGMRVPALIVSPWATRRTDSTLFDHTSVLKFVIDLWGLGGLGERTAAATSIAVTLREPRPRTDTVPFIRVSYTNLIPPHSEWEKRDSSGHHGALSAFAYFLAQRKEAALPAALSAVAKGASWWAKTKATIGERLVSMGNVLMRELERFDREKGDLILLQISNELRGREGNG
jgi:phospholipase C